MANVNKLQDANGNEYNLQDTISGYQNATQVNSAISTHNSSSSAHSDIRTELSGKQATLVSGTNIKTVNSQSLLGSGNISISASANWGSIGGTLSNQTDLNTALNNKVNTSSLAECKVVITTYVSGTSGYRIWNDGYCEQWGFMISAGATTTINFAKTFANTNYFILLTQSYNTTGDFNANFYVQPSYKTVTAIQIKTSNANSNNSVYWKVGGYLATGQY